MSVEYVQSTLPASLREAHITGTEVHYLVLCPRKLWWSAHGVEQEHVGETQAAQNVALGQHIHAESYPGKARKEYAMPLRSPRWRLLERTACVREHRRELAVAEVMRLDGAKARRRFSELVARMSGLRMKSENRFVDVLPNNVDRSHQVRIVRQDDGRVEQAHVRIVDQMNGKIDVRALFFGTVDIRHFRHHARRIDAGTLQRGDTIGVGNVRQARFPCQEAPFDDFYSADGP